MLLAEANGSFAELDLIVESGHYPFENVDMRQAERRMLWALQTPLAVVSINAGEVLASGEAMVREVATAARLVWYDDWVEERSVQWEKRRAAYEAARGRFTEAVRKHYYIL